MQTEEQAKTQAQILNAAMRHFAEHGYRGASISKIAEDAGVSKSLIFWYFDSKGGLFQSLIDRFIRSCKDSLADAGPAGDAKAKIEKLVDTFWDFIGHNLWFVRIFINWFMQLAPQEKEKLLMVRDIHREFRGIFTEYLQEGKEQRLFREDLDIANTSLFIVSALEGILLQLLIEETDYKKLENDCFFQSLKLNLMEGLMKKIEQF